MGTSPAGPLPFFAFSTSSALALSTGNWAIFLFLLLVCLFSCYRLSFLRLSLAFTPIFGSRMSRIHIPCSPPASGQEHGGSLGDPSFSLPESCFFRMSLCPPVLGVRLIQLRCRTTSSCSARWTAYLWATPPPGLQGIFFFSFPHSLTSRFSCCAPVPWLRYVCSSLGSRVKRARTFLPPDLPFWYIPLDLACRPPATFLICVF